MDRQREAPSRKPHKDPVMKRSDQVQRTGDHTVLYSTHTHYNRRDMGARSTLLGISDAERLLTLFTFSLALTPFIYPPGVVPKDQHSQGEFVGKSFPTNDFVWEVVHNSPPPPKKLGKFCVSDVLRAGGFHVLLSASGGYSV